MRALNEKHYVQFRRKEIKLPTTGNEILYGKLLIKIKTLEPFLVSDGILWGRKYKFLRSDNESIIIPGSSIKGAFRTFNEVFYNRKVIDEIFGSNGSMSKIMVNDVIISKKEFLKMEKDAKLPQQWGKTQKNYKDKYGGTIRLYRCDVQDKTTGKTVFSMESIDKDKEFEVIINFHRLSKDHIKYFLTAIGANPKYPFSIKMGRGKNYKKGRVKVVFQKAVDHEGNEIKIDWENIPNSLKEAINEYKERLRCK